MFLKKRRLNYKDFINNVEFRHPAGFSFRRNEPMQKPNIKPKIQALLNKINPPVVNKIKQNFIKPQSEEEWQNFHKIN